MLASVDQLQTAFEVRSSTSIPADRQEDSSISYSKLESVLRVAITSRSKLTELIPITAAPSGGKKAVPPSTNGNHTSSVYEVPALPGAQSKDKFLASENERTGAETPATMKSRTEHFRTPGRVQTPHRHSDSHTSVEGLLELLELQGPRPVSKKWIR